MSVKIPQAKSSGEERFAVHVRVNKLPAPVREHRFHDVREWRFDFAWPKWKLAVEIEGGTRSGGRHTRHDGFERDAEKYNAAALLGWTVLRFTPDMVKRGGAIDAVQRFFERWKAAA